MFVISLPVYYNAAIDDTVLGLLMYDSYGRCYEVNMIGV